MTDTRVNTAEKPKLRPPTVESVRAAAHAIHWVLWTSIAAMFLGVTLFASFKPGAEQADWNFRMVVVMGLMLIVFKPPPKTP